MGALYENVSVLRNGAAVNDALVRVNGEVIPRFPNEAGTYSGALQSPVPAGQALTLEITIGPSTVTGTGLVPEAPVLTGPIDGAFFSADADIVVTWTSSSEPDRFRVSVGYSCGTNCGAARSFDAPGTARSLTVPASALPSGQPMTISVFAYNDGAIHGDYAPFDSYPGMNIRAESSNQVTVSR